MCPRYRDPVLPLDGDLEVVVDVDLRVKCVQVRGWEDMLGEFAVNAVHPGVPDEERRLRLPPHLARDEADLDIGAPPATDGVHPTDDL